MSDLRRPPRPRPNVPGDQRAWIIAAALFAPLVLLLVVAVRTWRAERRYAAVAQQVVHDYAAIAAWQYARRANSALHDEAMRAFRGVALAHQRTGPSTPVQPASALLAAGDRGGTDLLSRARFAFTYDAASRRLEAAGGQVDSTTRVILERHLRRLADAQRRDGEPHRVLFERLDGRQTAIAVWMLAAPERGFRAAYGVVADAAVLDSLFATLIEAPGLLPGTATSGVLDERDVAVRLARPGGDVVFATARDPGATAATDSAGLQSGELHVMVDLSPRLAGALLVGGAPGSQLPSLALMILAAMALAAVGLSQLRRSRELARARSRFVANVSHELRTPLTQISMFAETLALGRERSPAEGRRFAAIIYAEARRLTGLVESVLRFSRLEAGRQRLRVERVDLAREVAEAVAAFAPIAELSEVSVVLELDEAAAEVDRSAFRQVLVNLLDNAVTHGGRGCEVRVALARRQGEIELTVDDDGPGVPVEWRERVFAPFVRVEQGSAPGAGIGLAVVREVVAAHGGHVWIDSSPRGGARFVVALPAPAASSPAAAAQAAEARP